MNELIGKYAYKKRGFFGGIIGIVRKNDEGSISPYSLEYKDGSRNGFNRSSDIVVVDESEVSK